MPHYGRHTESFREHLQRARSTAENPVAVASYTYQRALADAVDNGAAVEFSFHEAAEAVLGDGWKQKYYDGMKEIAAGLSSGEIRHNGVFFESANPVTASEMLDLSNLTTFALDQAVKQGMMSDMGKYSLLSVIPRKEMTGAQARNGMFLGTPFSKRVQDARVAELEPAKDVKNDTFSVRTPTFTGQAISCSLTKEAIEEDRTSELIDECVSIGQNIVENDYDRLLAHLLGCINKFERRINTTTTPLNTYQTATPWINVISGNVISDEVNLEPIVTMLGTQPHPTREHSFMSFGLRHVLCAFPKQFTLQRILNKTEFTTIESDRETRGTPLFAGSFQLFPTPDLSPILRGLRLYPESSVGTFTAAAANEVVIAGEFDKALRFLEVRGTEVKTYNDVDPKRRIDLEVVVDCRNDFMIMTPEALVFNYGALS